MAAVYSLGLHEPSAVPYLVAESVISPHTPLNAFTWKTCCNENEGGVAVEEELFVTDNRVVWSRGGVVIRAFGFDVENEKVTHALFAYFPGDEWTNSFTGQLRGSHDAAATTQIPAPDPNAGNTSSGQSRKLAKQVIINEKHSSDGIHGLSHEDENSRRSMSRALVVVLQSQMHIFIISGDTHVVPLPFEVDSIWAAPCGLLFQAQVSESTPPPVPPVPPNSFVSPQNIQLKSRTSGSFSASARSSARFSLTMSPSYSTKSKLEKEKFYPRTFSLLDHHSEMGLVAVSPNVPNVSSTLLEALSPLEDILYVSSTNELPHLDPRKPVRHPLILVVTLNETTGLYTVWTAQQREKSSGFRRSRKGRTSNATYGRRRSSYFDVPAGVATPASRGANGLRESFGILNQVRSASHTLNSQVPDAHPEKEEALASQLGQDFGDIGASWKASRRVSSLLARSDLGGNHDRTTFTDLMAGNQSNTPFTRKVESFAGSTRASFGYRRRSSLPPGNPSVFSAGSSFLDVPVDKFLEGLNKEGQLEGFETMGLGESVSGLPREIVLSKVGSYSSGFSSLRGLTASEKRGKFEVFTVSSFYETYPDKPDATPISVCILNKHSKNLVVLNLQVQKTKSSTLSTGKAKKHNSLDVVYNVQLRDVRQGSNVIDCRKLIDGEISRMLVLSTTLDGRGELTLQAPWSTLAKIELPSYLGLYEPSNISPARLSNYPREAGLRRVLDSSSFNLCALDHPSHRGKVDIVDDQNRKHRLQVQMEPRNVLVKRILNVCRFVLRQCEKGGDGILVTWWETLRWLRSRNENCNNLEWTALVVTLFSMAVYFIEGDFSITGAKPKRKRGALLRSSSGFVDFENWDTMLEQEAGSSGISPSWMMTPSWGWIREGEDHVEVAQANHPSNASLLYQSVSKKNQYIIRCASLARQFILSPQGEATSGAEGYLPTAVSKSTETRRTALGTILVALHLLREELKLSSVDADLLNNSTGLMLPVLAQIGTWLGWKSWTWKENSYYGLESSSINGWSFEESEISTLDIPSEPFAPPSVFQSVEHFVQNKQFNFITLLDLVSRTEAKRDTGKLWEQAIELTPRTLAVSGVLSEIELQSSPAERAALLLRWGLTTSILDTLPYGISAPLHEAIAHCRSNPSLSCEPSILEFIDRNDISLTISNEHLTPPIPRLQVLQSHDASRDILHIGSSVYDGNGVNSFEASAEADRLSVTKLIFRDDRRFFEAVKVLNQMRAPVVECQPEPDWSEADLLEAQQELVQLVTLRTLSIPSGRGLLFFSSRVPLSTEKLPIPSFSLQCVVKPSNITISADKTSFTEEKVCWAFFHNGASTGLAISKAARGIDTSWILYNKPGELTNRHAGFLLALGLNGHLKCLAKWVAFKYLTPKHTMTSVGLLLGLSASYLGTMDTLIARLLSVHVTRMLPPGAAELNLSPLTQTTGIMGIGLLYCNSQHRRMSEIMLSEIENTETEDTSLSQEILRDEGYRLAAGFALGFINLAKGKDLGGLRDMRVVERLLALAVGTRQVDMVHTLDRATAGATIALAIIFMKSNDAALAKQVDIPDTAAQFDYVRPDIFLLRTLARHLIMWDAIKPNHKWVEMSLPLAYRSRCRLLTVRRLSTDDMPLFNIIAGICFAMGLRYAGSRSKGARDVLVFYLDQFIRICRLPAINYDSRLTRNSARNCQDVIALSAAVIMAGAGDVPVFRRLRSLHGRVDMDTTYGSHLATHMAIGILFLGGGTHTLGTSDIAVASLLCALYPVFPTTVLDNKCHLQAFRHLWVLAAEPRCLIPRDLETGRAMPIPVSLTFKSGETRMTIAPCLLPEVSLLASIKVQSPDHWKLNLDFTADESLLDKFRCGNQSIYLKRRTTYNIAGRTMFSATMSALTELQDVPVASSKALSGSANPTTPSLCSYGNSSVEIRIPARHLWEWIFKLPAFRHLDMSEKTLVLPPNPFDQSLQPNNSPRSELVLPPWIRPTVVEARLSVDRIVRDMVSAAKGRGAGCDVIRDRLWQLRLLFAWLEQGEKEGGKDQRSKPEGQQGEREESGLWLRKSVIDDAKWKIWAIQAGDVGAVGQE
ncbi:Anaphase-promoting complex subunit 1 [Ophidiomyces ophidiicola]|nr:Anaphase-promoting complex subunit 1 [Ophidiomyces ophidiicola]KAI2004003.1 Anaphase-promoting complex subunit 1 [Ophidiomyces ophidiicola]KAI2015472.1 Anaphase-promoting complex subunit 1 [Ophidiomyces ophidiicola]KAI2128340.1 Anaphase-promoting complex subunit 1 [Ophidiomyces ophidiicola]KAI2135453.1 Anaphase-promoting complex subunit 1 [Ophidiomyces ophidiicola]